MKHYYIYKTTNLINGRYYIGKRETKKLPEKDSYLGSGKTFKKALKKYGRDSFEKEILSIHSDKKTMNEAEVSAIGDKWKLDECYNLKQGGEGGSHGKEKEMAQTPEWRNNVKKAAEERSNNEEWRNKCAEGNKARSKTPEWREAQKKGIREKAKDPEWQDNVKKAAVERSKNNEEWRNKCAEGNRKRAKDPKWQKTHQDAITKMIQTKEWKDQQKKGAIEGNKKRIGNKWWNNGEKEIQIRQGNEPPPGFTKGRLKRS